MVNHKATMTPKESTRITGFGIAHTYRMLREGTMPSIRCGKKYVIPRAALQRFLETCGGQIQGGSNAA